MQTNLYRYFIQLQPVSDGYLPRPRFLELQRQQADDFILCLRQWLADHDLQDQVASLTATLFGQIQITCTADVMQRVRQRELQQILAIQSGRGRYEGINRGRY